jgi:hypothetical protein
MGAAHVPLSVILSYLCVAVGGNGTTAGCVAPDRSGSDGNRSAPQPGTALDTRRYGLDEINQGYQDLEDGKLIRGIVVHED